MKLSENLIRQLIQKSLLLEAKYQFRNLLIFKETIVGENNLFDEINNTFIQNGGQQHDLNNPKSAGRFFIDILFECMEEINEIIDAGRQNEIDIPDRIMTICNYILFLFEQKEVTSRTVRSGQTFKDYILNFMTYYSKTSYPGTTTIFEKLSYVFGALNEKSAVSSLDIILKEKNHIKSEKETLYPFGKDAIVDGYKVVSPMSTKSSIFWARTNWLAEDIVLPDQSSISWCTARFKGGNMFNTYFVGGGTNLFYFLPEGDVEGKRKFCIGITKIKKILDESSLGKEAKNKKESLSDDDYKVWEYEQWKSRPEDWTYMLTVGGHTTVNFANKVILEGQNNDFSSKEIKSKLKRALKISNNNILNQLEKEMIEKEPVDNEKYVSLLDVEQFAASTNINSLAPIDPVTGKRDVENLRLIKQSINSVLTTYNSRIYKVKGLVPDEKIVNYIDKNYMYWQKEGLSLDFYIPIKYRNNREAIIETIKSYIASGKNNYSQKAIGYKELLNIVPSSFQNDPDIFKLCLFENIMKKQDNRKIYHDFNFAEFSNDIEKLIQTCADVISYVETAITGFLDETVKNEFSSQFFSFISTVPEIKEKIKKLPDEKLIELFFKFKNRTLLTLVPYEYYLNNPDVLLKIADFSNKNSLPNILTTLGVEYGSTFGEDHIVPFELLSNKEFMLKLIKLDERCFFLLNTNNSQLAEDEDINLIFLSRTKNNQYIRSAIKNLFDKKNQKEEIITYDFLKNLCDKNIISFYTILQWTLLKSPKSPSTTKKKSIKSNDTNKDETNIQNVEKISPQIEIFLEFITDFVSNEKNVYDSIFSYEYHSSGLSPARGAFELFSYLNQIVKENGKKYNSLKSLYRNITSNILLFRKIINFEKKKYNNEVNGWPYVGATYDLDKTADTSIRKEVEEYMKSNVIIERKENKKLILTESQLRKLINCLL